jgi:DNA repair protein RadA/Sms
MVKVKTQFVCQQCSATYSKWAGRCENCGEWNTLVEQAPISTAQSSVARAGQSGKKLIVQPIKNAKADTKTNARISTGVDDLDVVLGGGIVRGSVTLLAGPRYRKKYNPLAARGACGEEPPGTLY